MLTTETLNAFALSDTGVIVDALITGQLLGTEVGDRVLAAVGNDPARFAAVKGALTRRNAWEVAA